MKQPNAAISEPTKRSGRVDLAALLDQFGGLREVLREVIEVYLDRYPLMVDEVRRAVAFRDTALLGRTAHTLKGAVCTFGVGAVTEAAAALERAGKCGDLSRIDEMYARLDIEVDQLRTELQNLLPALV